MDGGQRSRCNGDAQSLLRPRRQEAARVMMQVKRPPAISAMHYRHLELGAEMVEHEGWTLPARYSDPEDEADRVRQAAGITDISPVGKIRLQGDSVDQALREAVPGYQVTSVGSVFVNSDDSGGPVIARLADDDCLIVTEVGAHRPRPRFSQGRRLCASGERHLGASRRPHHRAERACRPCQA